MLATPAVGPPGWAMIPPPAWTIASCQPSPQVSGRAQSKRLGGGDDLLVLLREFSLQAVNMHMVDPGQTPERLISLERDAKRWVTGERTIAVAVPMQDKIRIFAKGIHGGKPTPV